MTGIAAAGAAELDAALNRFVAQNGRPGAAAGVVHGDELVWTAGAGFADTGTRVTGDLGTLYRIASITKTFTGTAVMQLRDAGRLDLDDPAVKYLPELRGAVSPFAAIEAVTGVPAGVAEGGLWPCVADLARWICFQLRAYTGLSADSPVLAAASLREMHKPRYLADDDTGLQPLAA